jgi:thymidine phosphorylase
MVGMDALKVGMAAWRLGAGRSRQGEKVQAGAGVQLHAKPGDEIKTGQVLMTLHTDDSERFPRALEILEGCVTIIPNGEVKRLPLIVERIQR